MTTETTERDLIEEAEALLAKVSQWHPPESVQEIEHALFADAIERHRGSPYWGYSKPVARLYYHSPELLRRLVEEVKRLRAKHEEPQEGKDSLAIFAAGFTEKGETE